MRRFQLTVIGLLFLLWTSWAAARSVETCCPMEQCQVSQCVAMGCVKGMPDLAGLDAPPPGLAAHLKQVFLSLVWPHQNPMYEIWTPPD